MRPKEMAKNETSLTFYGEVNEIGGNKILLQDALAAVYSFVEALVVIFCVGFVRL